MAEVVRSNSTQFLAARFRAKYGRDPDWGTTDKYGHHRRPSALGFFFYGNGVMPTDIKERLKAFVPQPVEAKIETLAELPAAYGLPYTRWNSETKTQEKGTEHVTLTVRETERTAQRELLSILRLVDAGKVAVSDKTRRASSATIDALTNILEGGDYYPRLPVTNKWPRRECGTDSRLRLAPPCPGGRACPALGVEAATHQGGTKGAFRTGCRDSPNGLDEVGEHDPPR